MKTIPENPTNKEIMEAFKAMTHAMSNFSAVWGNVNEVQNNALSSEVYPFNDGFDDVLTKVVDWANATKGNLEEVEK